MSGKSDRPPPLPLEVLLRVLSVSTIEGWLTLGLSTLFAFGAAIAGDLTGMLAGCAAAGAGAMEVQGGIRLRQRDPRGCQLLVRSQLVLLGTVLAYVVFRLNDPVRTAEVIHLTLSNSDLRERLAAQNIEGAAVETFVQHVYRAGLYLLAVLSLAYQGGMALFYLRRRESVLRALEE